MRFYLAPKSTRDAITPINVLLAFSQEMVFHIYNMLNNSPIRKYAETQIEQSDQGTTGLRVMSKRANMYFSPSNSASHPQQKMVQKEIYCATKKYGGLGLSWLSWRHPPLHRSCRTRQRVEQHRKTANPPTPPIICRLDKNPARAQEKNP